MGIRSKRRARGPAPDPPSRRRRKDVQHVHGLPWEAEWRDWAALPSDVLWVILSLVPQADVPRGAGRACSSWRRLALDEPLLWRHIDLAAVEDMDKDPPAGWRAMARAAVRRSAGRCESYRGRVDDNILPFLGRRAPSLQSLHVTCRYDMPGENFVVLVAKKLPMLMLEQLVLSSGLVELASLAALVGHCPRLRVLDAGGCHAHSSFDETLVERLESKIKDLRLPVRVFPGGFLLRYGAMSPRTGRLRGSRKPPN